MRFLLGLFIFYCAVFAVSSHNEKSLSAVTDATLEKSGNENDNKNLSSIEEVSQKLDQENAKCLKRRSAGDSAKSASEGASKDMHIDHVQQGKDGMAYEINIDDGKSANGHQQKPKPSTPRSKRAASTGDPEEMSISNERKTDGGMSYSIDFNGDEELKSKPELNSRRNSDPKSTMKRHVLADGIVREPSDRLKSSMERHSGEIIHYAKPRFDFTPIDDSDSGFGRSEENWRHDGFDRFVDVRPSTAASTPEPLSNRFEEVSSELSEQKFNAMKPYGYPKYPAGEVSSAETTGSWEHGGLDESRKFEKHPNKPLNLAQPIDKDDYLIEDGFMDVVRGDLSGEPSSWKTPPLSQGEPEIKFVPADNSTETTSVENEKSDQNDEGNVVVVIVPTSNEIPDRTSLNQPFSSMELSDLPPWHRKPWHHHSRWQHRRPPHHRLPSYIPQSESSSSEESRERGQTKDKSPLTHYETNYITNNIIFDSDKKHPLPEPFHQSPLVVPLMQMAAPPIEPEFDPTLRKQIADNRFGKSDQTEVLLIVDDEQETIDPQSFSLNLTVGPMTLVVIFLALLLFFFIHLIRRMLVVPAHNSGLPTVIPMKA